MGSALAAAAALLAAGVQLPDLTKGEIGGKVAALVWPRFNGELIQPVDCTAHLVPFADVNAELLFQCGIWFQPSPGTYRIWLEQQDLVSPHQSLLVYSGGPFKGRGLGAVFDVVVGGRVRISPDVSFPAENQLRLLHLDSHTRLGTFGRAFERRLAGAKAHSAALMPSGRIIAVTTDAQGDALTVSRPLTIAERATLTVFPKPPPTGSDVLVVLNRSRTASHETVDAVRLTLDVAGDSSPPDVFVTAADRIYGVWYGVDARTATLTVESSTLELATEEIRLRPGKVATVRRTLKVRPSIDLSILAPTGAFENLQPTVEVRRWSGERIRQVGLSSHKTRIEYLPAEALRVFLKAGAWTFVRDVDLTAAEDREVVFDLKPIVVTGKVYRGDVATPASIKFHLGEDWISDTADHEGRYEIILWEPRMYVVEIDVANDGEPPFREYFVDIRHSDTRDFHVPDSHYIVHVTDADSGKSIPGAEVAALNKFVVRDKPEQSVAQRTVTDEQGKSVLPPLRPGSLIISAHAKGYVEFGPLEVPVDDGSERQTIAIRLQAERDASELNVRLPTGAPAAGAEIVAAVWVGVTHDLVWRSATDAGGTVRVPKRLNGSTVLVRHPSATPLARIWTADAGNPSTIWNLTGTVRSLVVKVTDGTGEPIPFAHIVLWVDGIPLGGGALRFFSGSVPATDRYGYWRAASLGGQNFLIAATRRPEPPLQSLATPIELGASKEVSLRIRE